MTLAEAGEIVRYWEANPPPHLLLQAIARLLGWQPARASQHAQHETSLAMLTAMPPPGLAVRPAADIAMPPPILDPAALRARNHARQSAATSSAQIRDGLPSTDALA